MLNRKYQMAFMQSKDQFKQIETKPLFDEKPLTRKEKADAFRFLAAQHLSKRGLHPFFEVRLDLRGFDAAIWKPVDYLWGRRADVLAIGPCSEITIVEVKSSVSDFNTDNKWSDYLKACDSFYFCSDEKTIEHIANAINEHEKKKKIGLMVCNLEQMSLEIKKNSRRDQALEMPDFIRRLIFYKALVSADVFFNGQYCAKLKPAYTYIDKPYA